jgi:predicted AAA+ superfamily ATPase
MIIRETTLLVNQLSEQFPAVLILGPRQCGKTTLARHFLEGEYFDLEKPSDLQVFMGDIELSLQRVKGPLIIDEAQTLPELFPILRVRIDENRRQPGRYFLLGSVNPLLIKGISESLAGRVGIVELTPFLYPEAAHLGVEMMNHWVRGGYPDACAERNDRRWHRWQENYIRMLIERDLPRSNVRLSPVQMRRLMGMVAHQQGGLLKASELGRSMGVSYHTVNHYLDVLEGYYLIRRLQPYYSNIGKRLVKSPKIYLRDSGVLHYLMGIINERLLLQSPLRGNSWEGYLIEQIISMEQIRHSGSQFFFFRTHAGAEIDLIIDRGRERIGFEFKCATSVTQRDWGTLQQCLSDGMIDQGYLLYLGERNFQAADRVEVVNAASYPDLKTGVEASNL